MMGYSSGIWSGIQGVRQAGYYGESESRESGFFSDLGRLLYIGTNSGVGTPEFLLGYYEVHVRRWRYTYLNMS